MEAPAEAPRQKICSICAKQFAQYTCPRCNVQYCSVGCYKAHNQDCTDAFQTDTLVSHMKGQKADPELQKKTIEMLQRLREEQDNPLEEDEWESLQKLNLDDEGEINLEDLPPNLREDFKRAITDGRILEYMKMEVWAPWWRKSQKVTPLAGSEGEQALSEPPPLPKDPVPRISTLTAKPPSPALRYHIVDILYSYCYFMRVYNGQWEDQVQDFAADVCSLSTVCGSTAPSDILHDLVSTVQGLFTRSQHPTIFNSAGFAISVLDDVACLMSSTDSVIRALQELRTVFQKAASAAKAEKKKLAEKGAERKEQVDPVKFWTNLERKMVFLQSWVSSLDPDFLLGLSEELRAVHEHEMSRLQTKQQEAEERKDGKLVQKQNPDVKAPTKLIQEI